MHIGLMLKTPQRQRAVAMTISITVGVVIGVDTCLATWKFFEHALLELRSW